MYKEIIISIIIIISVIIVNNMSQKYTDKIIDEKRESLMDLREQVEQIQDKQSIDRKIVEKSDEMLKEWKEHYYVLAIYLEHDELEKVQKELVSLKANADVGDYDEMIENIEMSIFSLEHLKDKEVLNVDNFF